MMKALLLLASAIAVSAHSTDSYKYYGNLQYQQNDNKCVAAYSSQCKLVDCSSDAAYTYAYHQQQVYLLDQSQELTAQCLYGDVEQGTVYKADCAQSDCKWTYTGDNQLQVASTNQCMAVVGNQLVLVACVASAPASQCWNWVAPAPAVSQDTYYQPAADNTVDNTYYQDNSQASQGDYYGNQASQGDYYGNQGDYQVVHHGDYYNNQDSQDNTGDYYGNDDAPAEDDSNDDDASGDDADSDDTTGDDTTGDDTTGDDTTGDDTTGDDTTGDDTTGDDTTGDEPAQEE